MILSNLLECDCGIFSQLNIRGITSDSREVKDGYAFICIDGNAADGHKFAKDACDRKAVVVIAQKDTGFENQIIVPNTRIAYAIMSKNWFQNPAKNLKIVGVTGTNGKTSASYMLKHILEYGGYKVGLIGTIQNMICNDILPSKNTTPSPYELHELFDKMVKEGCEYCIMEVSSHALDQYRIYGVELEAAMFTNLTQDHLDYHKTMEKYFTAKKRLFTMCKKAILNFDDPYFSKFADGLKCEMISYSIDSDEASYTAKNIKLKPRGVEYEMVGYGIISRIKVKTGGKFSVYNSLCAASCAVAMGISINNIASAIALLEGVKGRAEVYDTNRDFTVIIDYAHTPDGLENILLAFKEFEKNRLIVLFGCGGDRDQNKRPIMGSVAARIADRVIVTSDNPRSEDPQKIINDIIPGILEYKTQYDVVLKREDAIAHAIQIAEPNDIIILAGKGHENYQVLKESTIHLDEREVLDRILK